MYIESLLCEISQIIFLVAWFCMVECESIWDDSLLQWVSLRRSEKSDLVGIFQIYEVKGCFKQRGQLEKVNHGLHDMV